MEFKKINPNENVLNPDPWCRLIGPQNITNIEINGKKTIGLIDTGCQVTNISQQYCEDEGLPIFPIDQLADIHQADGSLYKYLGFTELSLECPDFPSFKLDIPVLVVPTTNYHASVPLTIGTLTLSQMLDDNVLQNDIDLPTPWKYAYHSMVTNRELAKTPAKSLGKVKTSKTLVIPPLTSHQTYVCTHKVKGYGMNLNIMVEPRSNKLKPGLVLDPSALQIKSDSSKLKLQIDNVTTEPLTIPKNTTIGDVFLANIVPEIMGPDNIFNSTNNSTQTQVKQIAVDQTNPLLTVQNPIRSRGDSSGDAQLNPQTVHSSVSSPVYNQTGVTQLNHTSVHNNVRSPVHSSDEFQIKQEKPGIKDQNKNNKESLHPSSEPGDDGKWVLDKLDLSGMSEWPPALQVMAKSLLCEYSDIFSKHDLDLGRTNLAKHDIQLVDYKPFKQAYRRIPPHLYEQVRAHLKEMLQLGAIRPSHSPWSSAIVLVQKKDGTLRFCIDLRELNNRTIRDNYSLPRIEHHLEQLIGATWFTTLDLKSGYWQVELTEESKPLTAFTVGPLGYYECVTMPFGANNAPATFQRLMENCLGDLNLKWCVVYLDDIIIFSKSPQEQLERLRAVFDKLRNAGLKLKPSKCNFFKKEIRYLGHIVSEAGIATDPAKIEKVVNWPVPINVNDVRSFLGFVGYYRKYIKGFSQTAKPLTDLLKGLESTSKRRSKYLKVNWGLQEQQAFDKLKQACVTAPVLSYADFSEPFILHTDSSLDGLGAVLYQNNPEGQLKVIAYASRGLSKPEKNYPAHKLEFLALKWAVTDKFKEYLYGAPFEVYTDNNPLTYVLTSAKLDATSQRWVAALASYNFEIFYRSGKHNIDADSLSRIKWPESTNDILANRQMCIHINKQTIDAICQGVKIPYGFSEILCLQSTVIPKEYLDVDCGMTHSDWVKAQAENSQIKFLIEHIQNKTLKKLNKKTIKEQCFGISPYLKYIPQFLVKDDLLFRKIHSNKGKSTYLLQIVLPPSLIPQALTGCHDEVGHLGRDKSTQLLKERFFWPSMQADMSQHINHCRKCLARKGIALKAPLCPITATKPLELVHMDYLQLEPSKGNVENVLVITDHYTRFAQAYPSKTQTAQATAKLLWDHFIVHYGFPEKFFSDQGRNFVSELIQDLCKIAGVDKIKTTPYHPMSNGQCERFNKTLCDMLGTLSVEDKADWKSHISAMTHAYNCTQNASTGYSPYYLMFGRQPRLPLDVRFGLFRNLSSSTFSKSKYIDRLKKRLDFAYEKANQSQIKESQRQKTRYDKKTKNIFLEKGDLVLVRIVAHKGRHKIQNKWEDEEYVIIDHPDPSIPVYKVKPVSGGKERILHRNLLLPLGTKAQSSDLSPDDSDEDIIEVVFPQSGHQEKQIVEPSLVSDSAKEAKAIDSSSQESKVELSHSSDIPFDSNCLSDTFLVPLLDEDSASSECEDGETKVTLLEDSKDTVDSKDSENIDHTDSAFQHYREKDSTMGELCEYFEKLQPPTVDSDSSQDMSQFLNKLDSNKDYIQEPKLDIKTEQQSEDSETDSEPEPQPVPQRRVSSRKTKGAPPQRYGTAYTHKISTLSNDHQKELDHCVQVENQSTDVQSSTQSPENADIDQLKQRLSGYLHKLYFGRTSY